MPTFITDEEALRLRDLANAPANLQPVSPAQGNGASALAARTSGSVQQPDGQPIDIGGLIDAEGATGRAKLIRAIAGQESDGGRVDTSQPNYAGARGPMQVTQPTFDGMKAKGMIPADWQWSNPEHSTRAGIRLVSSLADQHGDDARKVAAAYYSGPAAIKADGSIDDTRRDRLNPKAPRPSQYADQVVARMGSDQVAASKNPPQWSQVEDSDEYQALSTAEKNAVRQDFFQRVIAPQVPTEDLAGVFKDFNDRTEPGLMRTVKRAAGKAVDAIADSQVVKDFQGGVKQTQALGEGAKVYGGALGWKQADNTLADMADIDAGKKPTRNVTSGMDQNGKVITLAPSDELRAYINGDEATRAKLRERTQARLMSNQDFINETVKSLRQYQQESAKLTGKVPEFTDIDSAKSAADWLVRNGVIATPTMAVAMVGAIVGGPAGLALASGGMAAGDLTQARANHAAETADPMRFTNPDRQTEAAARAPGQIAQHLGDTAGQTTALIPAYAALDFLGPEGSMARRAAMSTATGVRGALKAGAKKLPGQMLEEGIGEGGQEVVNIGGEVAAGERQGDWTGEDTKRVINNATAGAAAAPMGHGVNVAADVVRAARAADPALPAQPGQGGALNAADVIDTPADAGPPGQAAATGGQPAGQAPIQLGMAPIKADWEVVDGLPISGPAAAQPAAGPGIQPTGSAGPALAGPENGQAVDHFRPGIGMDPRAPQIGQNPTPANGQLVDGQLMLGGPAAAPAPAPAGPAPLQLPAPGQRPIMVDSAGNAAPMPAVVAADAISRNTANTITAEKMQQAAAILGLSPDVLAAQLNHPGFQGAANVNRDGNNGQAAQRPAVQPAGNHSGTGPTDSAGGQSLGTGNGRATDAPGPVLTPNQGATTDEVINQPRQTQGAPGVGLGAPANTNAQDTNTRGGQAQSQAARPEAPAAGTAPAAAEPSATVPGAASASVEARGLTQHGKDLAAKAKTEKRSGDVMLADGRHVALADAKKAARLSIRDGSVNAANSADYTTALGVSEQDAPRLAQAMASENNPVTPKAPVEQDAPRSEARGTAKHPATVMGSRLLALVSHRLGGLDPAWLGEFSHRQETARADKNGRPMVQWRNPLIPGVGKLFRSGGTQDLSMLAEFMESHGYLPPGTVEADSKEAGEQAKDLIRRALNRDEPLTMAQQEDGYRAELEARRDEAGGDYYAHLSDEAAAEAEAERRAIMDESDIAPAEMRAVDDADLFDLKPNHDTAAAMRALGFPEQEIADALAEEAAANRQASRGAEEAGQDAAAGAGAPDRAGKAAPGPDQEGLTLQAKTEADREDAATAEPSTSSITDVGEKIGGARKDTAISGGTRSKRGDQADTRPTWAKRFQISQIVTPGGMLGEARDAGRWVIRDTRNLDWTKQPKQVGRNTFATKEEADAYVPIAAVSLKHRPVPTRDGKYEIWRDVSDRKRVKVVDREFASHDEAMAYMAQHAAQIVETNTTFGEADMPLPPDRARSGPPRREGNVSGQDFKDTFGLRGVEFGNWNNQDERQALMNDAWDGLADLAEVLDIPPKAIGLNGDLALAFGARGHGLQGARAHYELERAVINLTKERGAGSLAHEWFHALDHYFGRQDGKASATWQLAADGTRTLKVTDPGMDMASGGFQRNNSGVRPEVRAAYEALLRTMFKKAEGYVEDTAKVDKFTGQAREELAQQLNRLRADLSEQKDVTYWKRNNKPASAEQLAEFDAIAAKMVAGELLATDWRTIMKGGDKPATSRASIASRWTNDALERLSAIYKDVRGRSGFNTTSRDGTLDRLRGFMERYSQRLKLLADAQTGTQKQRLMPTEFAMNAKELDQGRGSDYWTTPHEMAARAFQGYVEDKIAQRGGTSRFLNYGPENAGILTPWGFKRPFPSGAERVAINQAMDDFMGVLQTREDDAGNVALYARPGAAHEDGPAGRRATMADADAIIGQIRAAMPHAPQIVSLESVAQAPKALREAIRQVGAQNNVEAAYHDGQIYVWPKHSPSVKRLAFVLMHHEIRHHGIQSILGKNYRPVLMGMWETNQKLRKAANQKMQDGLAKSVPEGVDEALADMPAEEIAKLNHFNRFVAGVRMWLRNTAHKLRQSGSHMLADMLDPKAWTDNDIAAFVGRAEGVSKRGAPLFTNASKTMFQKAANAITESPAFKRWFGDSKVVDAEGKPLVVYHGAKAEFNIFDTTRGSTPGSWFTSEHAAASEFGRPVAVYLMVRNPATMSEFAAARRAAAKEFDPMEQPKQFGDAVIRELESKGFDGVHDSKFSGAGGAGGNVWAVLRPEQIKSATGNNGEFDPTNADIRFSRAAQDSTSRDATDDTTKPADYSSGPLDWLVKKGGGELIRDWVTDPAITKVSELAGKIIPEKVKMGLQSDYGLSEEYLDRKVDREASLNHTIRQAKKVIDGLAGLNREASRIAYQWMSEKPDTALEQDLMRQLPEHIRKQMADMKQMVDDLGRAAVDAGLLSPESFERNRMAYLHRTYAEHQESIVGKPKGTGGKSGATIRADTFKGRGIREDVGGDALAGQVGDVKPGAKFLRIEKRNAAGKLMSRRYIGTQEAVPAGWTAEHEWEARFFDKTGKVGMWRDLTQTERQKLGEIDEVRFAFAKTALAAARDIENARFLSWVSEKYARDDIPADQVQAAGDSFLTLKTYGKDEYVRVPDTGIPKSNLKKFGALAGQVIPGVVWNDIRTRMSMPESDLAKLYQSTLKVWKVSKTALSPAVHTNNVMSNFIMADVADVGAHDVAGALRTMIAAKRGDEAAKRLIERYQDSGAEHGSFAAHDLNEGIIEPILRELQASEADELGTLKLANIISLAAHGQVAEAGKALAQKAGISQAAKPFKAMIAAYQAEDGVFRLAKFMKELEHGASDRDAGKASRDAFLNYDINAPWIQAARRTALPFVAFSYRAIPLMMQAVQKKPWKVAKYMMAASALNAMGYALLGSAGDEDKERRLHAPELQGKMLGIFPRLVRMPWNDEHGSPVFLDVRRWVPAGDVFDLNGSHAALPMPGWLTWGGPLSIMSEFLANKSSFTGKPITLETDTAAEKAAKVGDFLFKAFAPNLPIPGPGHVIPGADKGQFQTYSWQGMLDAESGKTDAFGREQSPMTAGMSALGVKLKAYPEDVAKLNAKARYDSAMSELNQTANADQRERARKGIDAQELQQRTAKNVEKRKEAAAEFRKAVGR